MALTIEQIQVLFLTHGSKQYGREAVSQLDHALQCAYLAEQAAETRETIVAALLHDLGHFLVDQHEVDTTQPALNDDLHQYVALPFLRPLFDEAVLEPVRLHVDAKRYLCATEQTYWDALSPASKQSLVLQGGVFSDAQAIAFMAQPYAAEAVRLRRYDDLAKVPGCETPPLAHFMDALIHVQRPTA